MDMTADKGYLLLEDGTIIEGESFGYKTSVSGEVVFTTSMVGYPESLTDPSYFGQILTFTYPIIGNYGVPKPIYIGPSLVENFESERIRIRGLIVSQYVDTPSHYSSHQTLRQWLIKEKIPALSAIDTRLLTQKLREKGVMKGQIFFDLKKKGEFVDINAEDLISQVTIKKPILYESKKKRFKKPLLLFDCGIKHGMIRELLKRDFTVLRVPWNFTVSNCDDYSGVMISNGPGDPVMAKQTIVEVAKFLKTNIPVFGICLGNQILGLAAGGKTYKLKYGHRATNQPVKDTTSNHSYITTHNHGFAVDTKSLSSEWKEWFVNLNDGTNEGIHHKSKPFFTVQFHSEANPGPEDTKWIFDYFAKTIENYES